jgi:acyl-CoA thioesterase-1
MWFRLFLVLPLLTLAFQGLGAEKKVLVYGDSLSAGYGLIAGEGWVALLAERTRRAAMPVEIVNASISGETTRGGLRRLEEVLARQQPSHVILELGGNDGLRGYPIGQIRSNLDAMAQAIGEARAKLMLLAIPLPPNYGPRYVDAFGGVFAAVAAQHDAQLVRFTRDLLPLTEDMMQADGIHPTAKAQPLMLDALWPQLLSWLDDPG